MKRTLLLLSAIFSAASLSAQYTNLVIQDFDTIQTPAWTYTGNGITYIRGTSASIDGPASSPWGIGGSWAWETNQQSQGDTLIFSNVTNLTNYDSVFISYRIAGFSVGSQNDGPDQLDHTLAMVSVDGGITYYNRLRVEGNSQSFWAYTATAIAVDTFQTNNTFVTFGPAGSGLRTTDGYSTARIYIPKTYNQVRLKLRSRESTTGERWCIDEVAVKGKLKTGLLNQQNLASHISAYPNPANDVLHVTVNTSSSIAAVYRLTDVLGKEVFAAESTTGSMSIPTGELAKGTYMLSVETAQGRAVKKVVVTH